MLVAFFNNSLNILGLILSVVVFIVLGKRKNITKVILLTVPGIIILTVLLKPEFITNLILTISEHLTFDLTAQGSSESIRMNLIRNGLFFLISTFGFGVGAGNIEYWMDNRPLFNTSGIVNIHNWWFEILVGYGLIIFILYIVFYGKLLSSFYKRYKYSRDAMDISLSIGMICFMIGYVIGSISSSSNINREWLWVFWGIAIAYQGISHKRKFNKNKRYNLSKV